MKNWKKLLSVLFFSLLIVAILIAKFNPDFVAGFLPETITVQIFTVLLVLACVISLFIFEWVRVDIVGMMVIIALPLLGLITPEKALSGFSSNAVIAVISVIIIGAGIDKTGVMNIVSRKIVKLAGKSETRIMVLISGTVAIISAFMQNIGAAALFLPVSTRISRQVNIPVSRILMPMGYCAIIGGCMSLVGSSSLIMLNDLMKGWWENNPEAVNNVPFEPLGIFSIFPIGLALLAAALLYFVFIGKHLLPGKNATNKEEDSMFLTHKLNGTYKDRVGEIFEVTVPKDFTATAIRDLKLREEHYCAIFGIIRKEKKKTKFISAPLRKTEILPGDTLAIIGALDKIKKAAVIYNWKVKKELDLFSDDLSPNNAGVLEMILTPRSELIGKSLRDFEMRKHYEIIPLAISRQGEVFVRDLSSFELQAGDAILTFGLWKHYHLLKNKPGFVFTGDIKGEILRTEKAIHAVVFFALALILAMVFDVKLAIAFLVGAVGMILSKVLTIDEAYRSVDWMTVFLLAGLIPLGAAFEITGAAQFTAENIVAIAGAQLTPLVLMILLGILASFFTLVISNVGTAVLLVPIAMNLAIKVGMDPKTAALMVAIAGSNTFILPTHQVNALLMRPGGYRIGDYLKVGTGMTIIFLIISITVAYFLFNV